jgi:twitching motility protein PilT
MSRVDSLLSILAQQGANELRLGTDREPKMLAFGAPKRLSIPSTPEETLRDLLGDILEGEHGAALKAHGRVDFTYEAAGIGAFAVRLTSRPAGGFDAVFLRHTARRAAPTPPVAPVPAPVAAAPPPPGAPAVQYAPAAPVASGPPSAPLAASYASGPADTSNDALTQLIGAAFSMRASDLHLTEGASPVVRVDGSLRRLGDDPVDLLATLALTPQRADRLARGLSVDMSLDIPGAGRARVHVFHTHEGLAAAVRLLPGSAPSLASLHMPVPIDDLSDLPHGLVLVCGATGAGKSTTLAALAQQALQRRSIVLTTLEDPIEFALSPSEGSLLRRREVGRDVPDFASGLRDALREDPDVLLLGEMRDPETIGLAITAAETGHLVLSSLHSRSAASAIERIVDAYPPERQTQIRVQLADALQAVVVQRLLPRARGGGRVPCVEVLRGTHAVASLIREGKTAQLHTAIQSGRRDGMILLERSLADRVSAGEVRIDDARAVANEPASLAMFLGKGDA